MSRLDRVSFDRSTELYNKESRGFGAEFRPVSARVDRLVNHPIELERRAEPPP